MDGNMRCSRYYGQPEPADCDAVVESIKAFRIGYGGNTMAFNDFYDEFIQRGAEEQYTGCNLHLQLPIYWRAGKYTLQCSSEAVVVLISKGSFAIR